MAINRRQALGLGAAAGAALYAPGVLGQAKPRLVVIGGGAGGATLARYAAKDSKGALAVTLIEPKATYHTCFFSNLFIGGFRSFESIGHTYGKLASEHGVTVVRDVAAGVDRDAKSVTLGDGSTIGYDALAVAPGIDFRFETTPGYGEKDFDRMPHAWQAGAQTQILKAQIEAMPEGGTYVMLAPPNPYRCPPGPYERVSMVAHALTQRNPTAKILILDRKDQFSKQALFMEGWEKRYPGMIEWRPGSDVGEIARIDSAAMTISTDFETIKADVCNVIPGQKAGSVAEAAGLTNETGFCPIEPGSMRSRLDEAVYVVGDSTIAGDMPKSGFSANSQAKVAANAIRAALTGSKLFPARYANTCWSLIGTDDGVKVGAKYEPTEEKIAKVSGFISQTGEDAALRKQTYEESLGWYDGITADIFG